MGTKSKRNYKKKIETKDDIATVVSKPIETSISYGFWFTTAIKDGLVKFWQDKEIFIFFKNRGLTDKETKSRYDEMLKLY